MKLKLINYLGLLSSFLSLYLYYHYEKSIYTYLVIILVWSIELIDYIKQKDVIFVDVYWLYYIRRRINPYFLFSLLIMCLSATIILEPETLFINHIGLSPFHIEIGFIFMLIGWHIKYVKNNKYILYFSSIYLLYVGYWIFYLINFNATFLVTDIYQILIIPIGLFIIDYECFKYLEDEYVDCRTCTLKKYVENEIEYRNRKH